MPALCWPLLLVALSSERSAAVGKKRGSEGEGVGGKKRGGEDKVLRWRQKGIHGATQGRVALITGITGQDGSYMAELLSSKGYVVHGLVRPTNHTRAQSPYTLHVGDLTDRVSLLRIVALVRPDELYNLGAQSHVGASFAAAEYTAEVDALGSLRLLEAIREAGLAGSTRFFQASSCEVFGDAAEVPQRETTPFRPRSPYGTAKLYAYWTVANYRGAYGMHASSGILFNHESPRRALTFVTRKITHAVARIHHGLQDSLSLGALDAKRDWGHARDYVRAMWLMLQQPNGGDFVIASGRATSVRSFVEFAFRAVGVQIAWRGEGLDEVGYDANASAAPRVYVRVDPAFYRPANVGTTVGSPQKAEEVLQWMPHTSVEVLCREMVDTDLRLLEAELKAKGRRALLGERNAPQ